MPTKEDPNILADAIVRAAKEQAEQERESKAHGAPIWLRVEGITSLSKRTQDQVVRAAVTKVRRSMVVRTLAIAWGLACFIGWRLALPIESNALYASLFALGLGVAAIYTFAARREIRAMLIDPVSSRHGAA